MFTFFVGNIKKQHATDSILIVHFDQILTPLYRVKHSSYSYITPHQNKQKCRKISF